MSTRHLLLATLLATLHGMAAATTLAVEGGRTPKPAVVIEKQEGCVAPPAEMRRRHMEMLVHQRDKTLREGVRGAPVSLNACISCHASSKNGSVIGSRDNFCQGCHSYVAVKIDCFECHQATPGKVAGNLVRAGGGK